MNMAVILIIAAVTLYFILMLIGLSLMSIAIIFILSAGDHLLRILVLGQADNGLDRRQ